MAALNSSRSSARWMTSIGAPMISTPYFFRMPSRSHSIARLRAVWPPTVGRRASGFSRSIRRSTYSGRSGITYVRSARSGSVMIVAGLELIRTTS